MKVEKRNSNLFRNVIILIIAVFSSSIIVHFILLIRKSREENIKNNNKNNLRQKVNETVEESSSGDNKSREENITNNNLNNLRTIVNETVEKSSSGVNITSTHIPDKNSCEIDSQTENPAESVKTSVKTKKPITYNVNGLEWDKMCDSLKNFMNSLAKKNCDENSEVIRNELIAFFEIVCFLMEIKKEDSSKASFSGNFEFLSDARPDETENNYLKFISSLKDSETFIDLKNLKIFRNKWLDIIKILFMSFTNVSLENSKFNYGVGKSFFGNALWELQDSNPDLFFVYKRFNECCDVLAGSLILLFDETHKKNEKVGLWFISILRKILTIIEGCGFHQTAFNLGELISKHSGSKDESNHPNFEFRSHSLFGEFLNSDNDIILCSLTPQKAISYVEEAQDYFIREVNKSFPSEVDQSGNPSKKTKEFFKSLCLFLDLKLEETSDSVGSKLKVVQGEVNSNKKLPFLKMLEELKKVSDSDDEKFSEEFKKFMTSWKVVIYEMFPKFEGFGQYSSWFTYLWNTKGSFQNFLYLEFKVIPFLKFRVGEVGKLLGDTLIRSFKLTTDQELEYLDLFWRILSLLNDYQMDTLKIELFSNIIEYDKYLVADVTDKCWDYNYYTYSVFKINQVQWVKQDGLVSFREKITKQENIEKGEKEFSDKGINSEKSNVPTRNEKVLIFRFICFYCSCSCGRKPPSKDSTTGICFFDKNNTLIITANYQKDIEIEVLIKTLEVLSKVPKTKIKKEYENFKKHWGNYLYFVLPNIVADNSIPTDGSSFFREYFFKEWFSCKNFLNVNSKQDLSDVCSFFRIVLVKVDSENNFEKNLLKRITKIENLLNQIDGR